MIKTQLFDHQKLIVDFAKDKSYLGIWADYGSGKSLTALTIIEQKKWSRVLIVSTKLSIEATWVQEILMHTDFRYALLTGTASQRTNALTRGLMQSKIDQSYYSATKLNPVMFLINFDGVKSIFHELAAANFEAIIIDESVAIKSFTSQRFQVLYELGKLVPNRYVMTGFPITENIIDLYSQIKFLDLGKSLGDNFYKFRNTYCAKHGYRYIPKKALIPVLLEKIKPFSIRVTNDVLRLPPKVYKTIKVPLTDQQIKLLSDLNNEFRLEFGRVSLDTSYIFTILNKSLQICDGFIQDSDVKDADGNIIKKGGNLEILDTNKDDALLSIIEEMDVTQNKVLIWCAYRFSIRKLEAYFKKLGIPTLSLTGDTENTEQVVNAFQNNPKYNVLIASIKKASASITLTNCRYVIYYSNVWSGAERGNSEARTHRIGSEKHSSIIYTDLCIKDSVEERVLECLRSKKELVTELKIHFGNIFSLNKEVKV
ncbi:DEAD/DEAH box helicase [Candidatus Roizmanbacteria bacterium]|nr:DEAD/DEAH box helicase [Candidatus Roizmanbacteria bacterium]